MLKKSKDKVTVFHYNLTEKTWKEIPNPEKIHDTGHTQEKHWFIEGLPLFILIIAMFVFLAWERHLVIHYADGEKYMEIRFSILDSKPRDIILYDQQGNKAAKLNRVNGYAAERVVISYTRDDNSRTEIYYLNGIIDFPSSLVNYDSDGSKREIFYSSDGLIDKLEETKPDGTKNIVYTFRKEPDETLACEIIPGNIK